MIKAKKLVLLLVMTSLTSCDIFTNNSSDSTFESPSASIMNSSTSTNDSSMNSLSVQSPSNSELSSSEMIDSIVSLNEETFRLSSISDIANDTGVMTYKMYSPYKDQYELKCNDASKLEVFDCKGNLIKSGKNLINLSLTKDEEIYVRIMVRANAKFSFSATATQYRIELPYEVVSSIDKNKYSTYSDSTVDPLKPAQIFYTKRDDGRGLYINSNNPEAITANEFNKSLCKQDVTGKDVFFTFEHNNANISDYYYGYRITNTDTKDIYVTVKNLGYQVSGAGSWLGEDEWIKFYNTEFQTNTSNYTDSQLSNFQAYIGFCNTYQSHNRKPITYRIPSGKYIYVMGGTTKDAYNNINVFDSANRVVRGGCSNGAVIFSVSGGKAEGSFLVYTDDDASKVNASEYVTTSLQNGYVVKRNDQNTGSQYIGYDHCHGVVDADLCWVFNDKTPSGALPVAYKNPYYTSQSTGRPYSEITYFYPREFKNETSWVTHINPNHVSNAVGTDMTKYITVDYETKQEISIDPTRLDGNGNLANIGNWMVDYIDTFTLVNQGDTTRQFTYNLGHNGVILGFVRDENGRVDSSFTPKYWVKISDSIYGEGIYDTFTYTIEVPAHSIVRFSVNYNLLANSYGCISHQAILN